MAPFQTCSGRDSAYPAYHSRSNACVRIGAPNISARCIWMYLWMTCACLCAHVHAQAQSYRVERFQDGRPLRQGKFLISAGWSLSGIGYSIDPLGIEKNPPVVPTPNDPSDGTLGISASVGLAQEIDAGVEILGTFGGPSFALWSKAGFLPYTSSLQFALQGTFGYSYAQLRYTVDSPFQPNRIVRGNLFTADISLPLSYDLDKEWTLMLAPHIIATAYNAGVGWDSLAPNGLPVFTLTETQASGWLYGFSIGAKVVRPSPEWWQYLLPVPFLASGSLMLSVTWHQSGVASWSLGYQHLFPSFGTLLTTVTQEEMDNIEHERKQKDSILAFQKRQIELERTRFGRALSAEIVSISGKSKNSEFIENPTLRVEEFEAEESLPLMPLVFFEHNSSLIPTRYRRLRGADRLSFTMEHFARLRPSDMYRNILNIVGKRMSDNSTATLTLIGVTSGENEEAANTALAERRAQSVAEYFIDVWKIAPQRIYVQVRPRRDTLDLPADERAWARCVEIYAHGEEGAAIIASVSTREVLRRVVPEQIRFGFDIAAGAGVKQWNLEITQPEGNEVRTLKLEAGTDANINEYIWNVEETRASVPASGENIVARLEITDLTNRVAESALSIVPVEYVPLAQKRRSAHTDTKIYRLQRWLFGMNGTANQPDSASLADIRRIIAQFPDTAPSFGAPPGGAAVSGGKSIQSPRLRIILRTALSPQQRTALVEHLGAHVEFEPSSPTLAQRRPTSSPEDHYYGHCTSIEVQIPILARQ